MLYLQGNRVCDFRGKLIGGWLQPARRLQPILIFPTISLRYLEHVQCRISLRYYPRGNVMITLISPAGTKSTLLFPRSRDQLANSFDEWPFLSVHFWGESPQGTWTLEVKNMGAEPPNRQGQGLLRKWQLIFYGTEDNPVRLPREVKGFEGRPTRPPQSSRPAPGFNFPTPSFQNFFTSPFSFGSRIRRRLYDEE